MLYIALGLVVVLVDQWTKAWVRQAFAVGETHGLIPGVLHLTYVRNSGAAFGLLQGRVGFFIATTIVVLILTFLYRSHLAEERPLLQFGYALGLAGALGNLIDRIRFGWVVDFIDVLIWPVFNVADSAIVTGVAILAWAVLTDRETKDSEGSVGDGG